MGHFNIATEGVRAGRYLFATLGIGKAPIPDRTDGYSLVPFPMHHERRERQRYLDPLYSLIRVVFNGKEENFFFTYIYNLLDTKIDITPLEKKRKYGNIKVELEGITFSSPIINVRNKKYDSTK
jgi:hypothetical protein